MPVPIPSSILERLKKLHIHADACFVGGTAFIVSITDRIKFCTAEAVGNRTDDHHENMMFSWQPSRSLKALTGGQEFAYQWRRLIANSCPRKNVLSYESVTRLISMMDINSITAGEHALVIERHIRHLKEGMRVVYHMLPFDMFDDDSLMSESS